MGAGKSTFRFQLFLSNYYGTERLVGHVFDGGLNLVFQVFCHFEQLAVESLHLITAFKDYFTSSFYENHFSITIHNNCAFF
jgi:hypothetical protein